jgi:hypothetical protein
MLLCSAPIWLGAARLSLRQRAPLPSADYQLAVRDDSILSACSTARSEHPGYQVPIQTGAAHGRVEDVEMDHIRSLRLKLLPVTGLLPLCLNCGRSSNGFLLVGPRRTKRRRLRRRKERKQWLR